MIVCPSTGTVHLLIAHPFMSSQTMKKRIPIHLVKFKSTEAVHAFRLDNGSWVAFVSGHWLGKPSTLKCKVLPRGSLVGP